MKPTLHLRTKDEWLANLAEQENDLRTRPLYDNEGEVEDGTPLPADLVSAAGFICLGMIEPMYYATPFTFQLSRFIDTTVDVMLAAGNRSILINLGSDGIASYSGHDSTEENGEHETWATINGASRYTGDNYELARFTTMVTSWVFGPSLNANDTTAMALSRAETRHNEAKSLNLSPFKAQRIIDLLNTDTEPCYTNKLKEAARHYLAQNSGYWAEREKEVEEFLALDGDTLVLSERDFATLVDHLQLPVHPNDNLRAAAQRFLAEHGFDSHRHTTLSKRDAITILNEMERPSGDLNQRLKRYCQMAVERHKKRVEDFNMRRGNNAD